MNLKVGHFAMQDNDPNWGFVIITDIQSKILIPNGRKVYNIIHYHTHQTSESESGWIRSEVVDDWFKTISLETILHEAKITLEFKRKFLKLSGEKNIKLSGIARFCNQMYK